MNPMDRLREVAELKARTPKFKELAAETGWSAGYCRQVVSRMVNDIRKRTDVRFHVKPNECDEQLCDDISS